MAKTDRKEKPQIAIVGGGWAGLSAAVELSNLGYPVTVIESSRHLGGRARGVSLDGLNLDNGQHIMLGAYRSMLGLLDLLNVDQTEVFYRTKLCLEMRRPHRSSIRIAAPRLPAPLHLLSAILLARGLCASDKRSAIGFCIRMKLQGFELEQDTSVSKLLERYKQSLELIEALWEPLCIATLNTPVNHASAQLFLNVIRDAFTHARADSDMLVPRKNLSNLLPKPAQKFIEARGGTIRLQSRAIELRCTGDQVSGIRLQDGSEISAQHVILAVPPVACNRLIRGIAQLDRLQGDLASFTHQPICTIYLGYPESTRLPGYFCGSLETKSQWIFDHRLTNQPGLIAVVISSEGDHMQLGNDELAKVVTAELAELFPAWPSPNTARVIREHRATFTASVQAASHRPANHTPLVGCWLAADFTDTGYPATLESAVRSGRSCALQLDAVNTSL